MNDVIANQAKPKLILASQSPRRKALLAQLGFEFSIQASDIDETVIANEIAYDYVLRLAKQKAQHIFNLLPKNEQANSFVLGSDTSVVFNGHILGKPESEADCIKTLSLLSNNQHQVLTAIALVGKSFVKGEVVTTNVDFKMLSQAEISAYWLTGEPQDKAGSYGIQGIAGQFVKNINGSYSAVVGLPLYETAKLLTEAGFVGAIKCVN
ncbi:Maf family protein [Colwellia echini]|uniref:dTTP/UTP pyrophosphatase n=1 Tax=Colwellia echini TaxID=1982103 RepID=A0ABY3N0Z5_9GAMM|nr:Maf family protein [Colwellia echini]TYK67157.1 septum formation inhibitor Maf [Colwellia echini]